jgi:hypothetical protein
LRREYRLAFTVWISGGQKGRRERAASKVVIARGKIPRKECSAVPETLKG